MVNTTTLEANIQGLEPSTTYTFRILAVNRAGASPPARIRVTTDDEGQCARCVAGLMRNEIDTSHVSCTSVWAYGFKMLIRFNNFFLQ